VGWAHSSNTPLKYYKRTQHSGGVTTPFIAKWPKGIEPRTDFIDQPLHITDVLPTLMNLSGAAYPSDFGGKQHPPLPGCSFAKVLTKGETLPPRTLYFSLFNNIAIVDAGWRLVTAYDQPWQLYDLTNDRTETYDLAESNPKRLREMLELQKAYEQRSDVRLRLKGGEREPEYAAIYRDDGKFGPGANEKVPDEKASLQRAKLRSQGNQIKIENKK
jgi:arylsulfatase